jgi:hypothetical protein
MPQESSKPTIYDPQSGRLVTADEARRLIQMRGGTTVPGALSSPTGDTLSPLQTPSADPQVRSTPIEGGELFNAVPEALATAASFHPTSMARGRLVSMLMRMLKTGGAGAFGEAAKETLQEGDVDASRITTRGIENALPSVIGDAGKAVSAGGNKLVRSAIASGRSQTTGKAVTGAVGGRAAPVGAKATRAASQPFTRASLDKMAATARKHGASISEAGVAKLQKRSVDLENKILSVTDPKLRSKLTKELDDLDALIPEIDAVVNKQATGGLGTARFSAGSGTTRGVVMGTLAGGGAMAGGMDPATAGLIATIVGLPIGAVEASPAFRMVAGRALSIADKTGMGLETVLRSLLTHERATDPAGGREP